MTVKEQLDELLGMIPEERQQFLLEFARFLSEQHENTDWRLFARQQFAAAYGEDEPEYHDSDITTEQTH